MSEYDKFGFDKDGYNKQGYNKWDMIEMANPYITGKRIRI